MSGAVRSGPGPSAPDPEERSGSVAPVTRRVDVRLVGTVAVGASLVAAAAVSLALPSSEVGYLATAVLIALALLLTLVA